MFNTGRRGPSAGATSVDLLSPPLAKPASHARPCAGDMKKEPQDLSGSCGVSGKIECLRNEHFQPRLAAMIPEPGSRMESKTTVPKRNRRGVASVPRLHVAGNRELRLEFA